MDTINLSSDHEEDISIQQISSRRPECSNRTEMFVFFFYSLVAYFTLIYWLELFVSTAEISTYEHITCLHSSSVLSRLLL